MTDVEPQVREARRIKQFAAFFKNYMGVSSFVVAALPVPVTMLKLIPVYPPDAGSLSVITSLICFLILAFIFFNRHGLARRFFEPVGYFEGSGKDRFWIRTDRWTIARGQRRSGRASITLTIAYLIFLTLVLFLSYLVLFLQLESGTGAARLLGFEALRVVLIGTYTAFFAAAEAAFVLMATKEYLQDLLKIPEIDLIDPDPASRPTEAPPPYTPTPAE